MIEGSKTLASDAPIYDVIIVGGGTCGSVLASRLSEDQSINVCLLEAGGQVRDHMISDPLQWPLLQGREFDWQYRTVPQKFTAGRAHEWPRGKLLGGSSCMNAMAHVRGHPADFAHWVSKGCAGWGYGDLLPYFIRSETSSIADSSLHGVTGPVYLSIPDHPHPITESYMAAGVEQGLNVTEEHNGRQMAGLTLNTLTIKDGQRQTTADAYLTPEVLARENLQVYTEATVTQVGFDSSKRCDSVIVRCADGGSRSLCASDAVVLCAGAIETPAMLMRSGLGPAAQLEKLGIAVIVDLPGVGENLQDHLLSGGNVYHAQKPVPSSRYQHSESLTYIHRGDTALAPEIVVACVIAPITAESFTPLSVGTAYTIMYGFTHPQSRGVVRLQSADPKVPPLIDPQYLSATADREVYLDALHWARAIGGADALSEWRGSEYLPTQSDLVNESSEQDFLARAAVTHHHPAGSCRMGVDEEAVVDPSLRVINTDNLYVMDASVMPRLTTGPINATLIAMAERASDLLRGLDMSNHAA